MPGILAQMIRPGIGGEAGSRSKDTLSYVPLPAKAG
jgi:hypothetical protein